MNNVVVRNIKRTDAGLVKRLGVLGVATAHEAYGRNGLMKPYMRPVWHGGEAAGTAVTVLTHPGDNWMIHVAVEQCREGDILVVGFDATDDAVAAVEACTMAATVAQQPSLLGDEAVRAAAEIIAGGAPAEVQNVAVSLQLVTNEGCQ